MYVTGWVMFPFWGQSKIPFCVDFIRISGLLYDIEYDDLKEKTLIELGIEQGSMITVTDEDEDYFPVLLIVRYR